MRIWTIKIGEPLPGDNVRLMRSGMITQELAARGADVTWWVSTFSHNHPDKQYVGEPGEHRRVMNDVTLRFVHGPPYQDNVSLARLRNHRALALDFRDRARTLPKPDLIFCAYPPIEIADEATQFGAEHGVPVIVDIRDLWPEAFLYVTPFPRPLMRLALEPIYARARRTLAAATGLTAITAPYLERGLALANRQRRETDGVFYHAYARSDLPSATRQTAEQFWRQQGLRFEGDEKIACFFGNLSATPDLDTPVAALEHLTGPLRDNLKMVICGSGEKLPWLKEQARNHPQLICPGRVGQAEIRVLLEQAHLGLLIYPNRQDLLTNLPNKFGEYLSGSLPILSTLEGLCAETLIGHDIGAVASSGDPAGFARQLNSLLTDERRHHHLVANAARTFTEHFDAKQVYTAFADHLFELADKGTAPER
ncbi:MAG: glycosyltransferase [Pseudomonadota bacterium]